MGAPGPGAASMKTAGAALACDMPVLARCLNVCSDRVNGGDPQGFRPRRRCRWCLIDHRDEGLTGAKASDSGKIQHSYCDLERLNENTRNNNQSPRLRLSRLT
jgi:hypothetical protein